ncbi:MAG: hypothetical protein P0Y66_14850 [Candidatus Kaistia colombiensis]|nr:MAG: hypothetical protein P0Y66_14850 [Kaistia sp.]
MRATVYEIEQTEEYVDRCMKAAIEHYDGIFLPGQLGEYEVKGTRPADNRATRPTASWSALHRLTNKVNHCHVGTIDRESREAFVDDTIA